MLLDVFDESALSQSVKEEMYKCYPNARLAHLKSGGNFPFLSRADEVNVYIQVSCVCLHFATVAKISHLTTQMQFLVPLSASDPFCT